MGVKKIISISLFFILTLFIPSKVFSQEIDEKPAWIKVWEDFVKENPKPEWVEWYKKISSPEALKLGKEWAELLGYDVISLTSNSTIAPDIKPGLVINSKNYRNYPGLKELLPKPVYERLAEGAYAQIPEIRIVPPTHYYYSKGMLEVTKKNLGMASLDDRGMLKNWHGGLPFIPPKNGKELMWNFDRASIGADNLNFSPIIWILFDKKDKLERTVKANIYWRMMQGRTDIPPLGNISETIFEMGSAVFLYPFDVRGFSMVRTRFADPDKPDYFIAWVPSIRRTRLFSGSDTQDPMFGTDITWDDWKNSWQKISPDIYPNEYKIVGETEILAPVYRDYMFRREGGKVYIDWERRPVWILDQISKDKSYIYSIRRLYIDKETFRARHSQLFDPRGRLWRVWLEMKYFDPKTGYWSWWGGDIWDVINKHRTLPIMQPILNDPKLTDDNFNLRALMKMAR